MGVYEWRKIGVALAIRHSTPADQNVRAILLSFFVIFFAGCRNRYLDTWEQHAYVWSRSDTAKPVSVPSEISAVHVLVAQWPANGDAPWMLKSAMPETVPMPGSTIVVVRLDGAAITVPAADVAQSLRQDLSDWRAGWSPQAIVNRPGNSGDSLV